MSKAIIDQHPHHASPRELAVAALADFDAQVVLYIDLPIDTPEVWVRMTDDIRTSTHKGREIPPAVGFMRLCRVLTQSPGLSRYVVRELHSADALPQGQSVCRRLSELIEPASYELLLKGQTVLPGARQAGFRPVGAAAHEESPREF